MGARQEIRAAIKSAALELAQKDSYWQDSRARRFAAKNLPSIEIKFMTQGSYAYRTLNSPAQIPQQEIDLDDGMYVPVEFLENGEPALAARGLFAFVERALLPLCQTHGWELDSSKETCVRVKLWRGAHIDLPIYSIPRTKFVQLRENMAATATAMMTRDSVQGTWKLPPDQVMLARRNGTWMQSDPQQLHDWVEARVVRYGPVYRRLSRFFKGWRDYVWTKPELSSLCVMCSIDGALRDLDGLPTENRDDELVLEVAKRLPSILADRVRNPVLDHLCLNEWSDEVRQEIIGEADALKKEIVTALERTGDAELVVQHLQNRFGSRLPYRPDIVKIASKIAAVQAAPAATVAAPRVIASTSG